MSAVNAIFSCQKQMSTPTRLFITSGPWYSRLFSDGGSIKYHPDLIGFVYVEHWMVRQVPCNLALGGGFFFAYLSCISFRNVVIYDGSILQAQDFDGIFLLGP